MGISKKWFHLMMICVFISTTVVVPTIYGQEENNKTILTGTIRHFNGDPVANYYVRLVKTEKDTNKGEIKIKKGEVTNPSAKTDMQGVFTMEIAWGTEFEPGDFLLSVALDIDNAKLLPLIVQGKPLFVTLSKDKKKVDIGTVILSK